MSEQPFDPAAESRPTLRPHYHGDIVRVLFLVIGVLIFLTQYVGTRLPYETPTIMFMILGLVLAAGITNPAQHWIHWVNMLFSALGLLIFGGLALAPVAGELFATKGLVASIAILFLVSLYFSTRTVRGQMVPHIPVD